MEATLEGEMGERRGGGGVRHGRDGQAGRQRPCRAATLAAGRGAKDGLLSWAVAAGSANIGEAGIYVDRVGRGKEGVGAVPAGIWNTHACMDASGQARLAGRDARTDHPRTRKQGWLARR